MKYLSVLGRQPEISLAELRALFRNVKQIAPNLATFEADETPDIDRLGGSLKLARRLDQPLMKYLEHLPAGKILLGISDYSPHPQNTTKEAMRLKKILVKKGRSVRIVRANQPVLPTAVTYNNKLGAKPTAVELIIYNNTRFLSIGTQNITAYAKRDQARPARDAKVGMLPPKLAQILINLCGPLPAGARVLDPFCGTGVLLQEAYLMGYAPYGTDKDPRMVDYAKRNLAWLASRGGNSHSNSRQNSQLADSAQVTTEQISATPVTTGGRDCCPQEEDFEQANCEAKSGARSIIVETADATIAKWKQSIAAVACETYLGSPMSNPPSEMKLKQEKQICKEIIVGFLKNLAPQIEQDTPVTLAVPAWLRPNGEYSRLNLLDDFANMEYNRVKELGFDDALLYHREGQIVAREIITLRKK